MTQANEGNPVAETHSRKASAATAHPPESPVQVAGAIDVVTVRKGKKKKKRKYSRGTKDVQRAARGLNRASSRVARAVADGFESFYRASEKSSRKRRDGAISDFAENWARAWGKSLRRASRAPYDFAKRLPVKGVRRQVRALVRLSFPFLALR